MALSNKKFYELIELMNSNEKKFDRWAEENEDDYYSFCKRVDFIREKKRNSYMDDLYTISYMPLVIIALGLVSILADLFHLDSIISSSAQTLFLIILFSYLLLFRNAWTNLKDKIYVD